MRADTDPAQYGPAAPAQYGPAATAAPAAPAGPATSAPPEVSATLAIDQAVRQLRQQGIDVLPLGFGQAGVPVHPLLRRALADASDQSAYGDVAGSAQLRAAAAAYWERRGLPTDPGQVLAGPGSKALLYAALQAIGGDAVVPVPSWVSYAAQLDLLGRRAIRVPAPEGEGGVPDPGLLAAAVGRARAAGRDVRAIVLTLPDNPTGTLAGPATVERACAVARDLGLTVISDEIYRDLTYRDPFLSPAQVLPGQTVVTSGLSKSLALGGWRTGVARLPDGQVGDRLRPAMLATASEIWSSLAQPVQHAAAVALSEPDEITGYVARARRLYEAINLAVTGLFQQAGAGVTAPQAAFYLYPDLAPHRDHLASAFGVRTGAGLAALLLREHGIAVLPGSAFGEEPSSLRLRVCTGMLTGADDDQRSRALVSDEPLALPWIAGALGRVRTALAAVTGAGAAS